MVWILEHTVPGVLFHLRFLTVSIMTAYLYRQVNLMQEQLVIHFIQTAFCDAEIDEKWKQL